MSAARDAIAHYLFPKLCIRLRCCIRPNAAAGGVIRTVIIDKDGVSRGFVPGDQLPFMLS